MAGLLSINGGVYHIVKKDGNPTCTQRPKPGATLDKRPIEDFDQLEVCYSCLHPGYVKTDSVPRTYLAPPEAYFHRKDFMDKD